MILCLSVFSVYSFAESIALISVDKNNYEKEYGNYVYELMQNELTNINSFTVKSRKNLDQILNEREMKKYGTNEVGENKAIELAKKMGAEKLIIPRIVNIYTKNKDSGLVTKDHYETEVQLTTKVIDLDTTNVIHNIKSTGEAKMTIEDANKQEKKEIESQSVKRAISNNITYDFQPKLVKTMNLNTRINRTSESEKDDDSSMISLSSIAALAILIALMASDTGTEESGSN